MINKISYTLLFLFVGCSSIYQTNPLPKQTNLYIPDKELELNNIDELEVAKLFDMWAIDHFINKNIQKPSIWSIGIKRGVK